MPELAERLRDALAGRYEVDGEIGKGGMAIVFRVRDVRHERWVALKVLRPELSSSLGAERFLREIRLAAGLQHPHILPVHDSGEAGGFLFYVMPYVEGESLRARLEREGQLPLDDALRIAREVADALHYAHQRDIVHRDIKPENILLSGGHALVADFGIARAISAAGGLKLTEAGLAVGTPAYMSPEQANAEDVDARADVYALGCVLYEMLAGEPPYRGPTAQTVMAQHSLNPVPSIRRVRPTVPEAVEGVVTTALAKAPADRFESAEAFAAALPTTTATHPTAPVTRARRFAAVAVLAAAVVLVFAGAWVGSRKWSAAKAEELISIAVAPIRNLGDTSDAYFADGLTQELTSALTRVRGIAPRPYTTVASAAARETNPLALGRALGVEYVLASTLRRSGKQLRISTELIRVKDGTNTWSPRSFQGYDADIFAMEDSITTQLARELAGTLAGAMAPTSTGRGQRNPEAYKLYLQARQIDVHSTEGSRRLVELYSRMLALDSTFADAWAGLAHAYSILEQVSSDAPAVLVRRRIEAVNRALALDSLNTGALMIAAYDKSNLEWDHAGADGLWKKVLALQPNDARMHGEYAKWIAGFNPDSAMAELQRALRLDPNSSHYTMIAAFFHQGAGRLAEADAALDRAFALDPNNWLVYVMRAFVALKRGQNAEAVRAAETAQRLQGAEDPMSWAILGGVYSEAGQKDQVAKVLDTLKQMGRRGYVEHAWFASLHLALGDRQAALNELETSANARETDFLGVLGDAGKELSNEPRYQALLRRANLGPYRKGPP